MKSTDNQQKNEQSKQEKMQYSIEFLKKFKSYGKDDGAMQNAIKMHFWHEPQNNASAPLSPNNQEPYMVILTSGDIDDSASNNA